MRNLFRLATVAVLLTFALWGVSFGPATAEAATCPGVGGGRCSDTCHRCYNDASCPLFWGMQQSCVCINYCP